GQQRRVAKQDGVESPRTDDQAVSAEGRKQPEVKPVVEETTAPVEETTAPVEETAAPVAEAPDTTSNDPAEKSGAGEARSDETTDKPKKKGK
nr:hypothetical protein [Actinomycetota bacterium]